MSDQWSTELLLRATPACMQASVAQPLGRLDAEEGLAMAWRPPPSTAQSRDGHTHRSAKAGALMPCVCAQAVSACRQAWGERCLSELDAEDRLATACEKAPTSDPATAALRAAFQVQPSPVHTLGLCQCHAM